MNTASNTAKVLEEILKDWHNRIEKPYLFVGIGSSNQKKIRMDSDVEVLSQSDKGDLALIRLNGRHKIGSVHLEGYYFGTGGAPENQSKLEAVAGLITTLHDEPYLIIEALIEELISREYETKLGDSEIVQIAKKFLHENELRGDYGNR